MHKHSTKGRQKSSQALWQDEELLMALQILFVSPERSITHTLVEALNAAGEFNAQGLQTIAELQAWPKCADVVLLDLDLGPAIADWGRRMRERCTGVHLVVLKADNGRPLPPDLHGWQLLYKPFHLDELTALLRRLPPRSTAPKENRENVTQALQTALLKTTAQAALLLREQRLWVATRGLPEHALAEAAEEITRISHIGSGNLLRFIHLRSNQSQHMLYVMLLDENDTLGILFNPQASFAEIRLQAERIVERFRELLGGGDESPVAAASPPAAEAPPPAAAAAEASAPLTETAAEDEPDEIPNIRDILQDVPVPTPNLTDGDPLLAAIQEKPPSIESNPPRQRGLTPETLEQTRVSRLDLLEETRLSVLADLEETRQSRLGLTRPASLQEEAFFQTPRETAAEEKPNSIPQAVGHLVLEPASPAFYNLHYACLLLTRRKEHRLDGDLKNFLKRWMRDVAVAYGWRIELLHIYPEFMQWVISIPPATSPNEMMRIIRQETSRRILESFPALRAELADDFWAPGYLLMGGDSLHPPVAVERYINQIRKSQDF